MTTEVEAPGIARASQFSQQLISQNGYVDIPSSCLHTACTDFALRELVASWHRVTPDVREKIMEEAPAKR
jgi:hypothetical protein